MSRHEHHECEHEIKYCKQCDVAYCEKCNKEWRQHATTWVYANQFHTDTSTTGTVPLGPVHYSHS